MQEPAQLVHDIAFVGFLHLTRTIHKKCELGWRVVSLSDVAHFDDTTFAARRWLLHDDVLQPPIEGMSWTHAHHFFAHGTDVFFDLFHMAFVVGTDGDDVHITDLCHAGGGDGAALSLNVCFGGGGDEVTLVEHHQWRGEILNGGIGDGKILLAGRLTAIQHDEGEMRFADGVQRLPSCLGKALVAVFVAGESCRVIQQTGGIIMQTNGKVVSDGITGGVSDVTHQHGLCANELIGKGGFAHIGLANDAHNKGRSFLGRRGWR